MAQDDSDRLKDDGALELELSPKRRARVEAERAKAETDFQSGLAVLDSASPDHVPLVENLLAVYIHHLFFASVEGALNQGYTAELIRSKMATGLPLLVERTFFLKHPYARSADSGAHRARFQQSAISVVHSSPTWQQVQADLVTIGERHARKLADGQPLPNLPREALSRIEQGDKDAKEIYDRDKVPYLPTNPKFSFLETSIFRSISHTADYVRLFAEAVIGSRLKEYVELAPSDLLSNECLLRSLERDILTLTGELWNGYGQALLCEPTSRRARYGIAMARGAMDEHPELEPWLYPEAQQWADFITRMDEPGSEMALLNERFETAIRKVISDQIKRYQRKAIARLRARGEDELGEKYGGSEPPLAEGSTSQPTKTAKETGGTNSTTQQYELPQDVRTPLGDEVVSLGSKSPSRSSDSVSAVPSLGNHRLFRKAGDVWELTFDGKTVHVKHSKGMEYIVHLLRSPDHEVHSAQLLMAVAGERTSFVASAGEVLDPAALKQYRSRIDALESQLDEAERNNDEGQKESAQEELEQLQQQVIRAVGFGGRARKAQDDTERFRKGVRIAIERAIVSIQKHHPALADHLKLRIKRGTFLVYQGDKIDWQL